MNRFAVLAPVLCLILKAAPAADPWDAADLLQPGQVAAHLAGSKPRPVILFVGFPVLYRSLHLPHAILAGPCTKPEGVQLLRDAVRGLPKDTGIVIYCGCCPFVKCPNVRPAYAALREMGFSQVKVMVLETNLHADWVAKGYPVEKGGS